MTHPPNKRRTGKEKGLAKQYKRLGVEDPDRQPTTRRSPMGKRLEALRARKAVAEEPDETSAAPDADRQEDEESTASQAATKADEKAAAGDVAKEDDA